MFVSCVGIDSRQNGMSRNVACARLSFVQNPNDARRKYRVEMTIDGTVGTPNKPIAVVKHLEQIGPDQFFFF